MSDPICVQAPFLFLYTLTWPEFDPFPSFPSAPTAKTVPSDDNETDNPDLSSAASPSISEPICWKLFLIIVKFSVTTLSHPAAFTKVSVAVELSL